MPAPRDPLATLEIIMEHLLTGGVSDLRSMARPRWIVGRTPSGVLDGG